MRSMLVVLATISLLAGCAESPSPGNAEENPDAMTRKLAKYTELTLATDVEALTDNERLMIPILIEAAREMDAIFWRQAFGDPEPFLDGIEDPDARRFAEINYGPWDRLAADEPFLEGYGEKPKGARFYPEDMRVEEFEQACAESDERASELKNLYTMVRRSEDGDLVGIPYHEVWPERTERAASLLEQAAEFADDPGLKRYLELRAAALRTDDYYESDLAWLEMKHNILDVVIGPIETYEDALFNYKAAHEAYVLVKDREWSARLARYAELLPDLQRGLPVPDEYKQETPGTDSDLNAYDVVYYAGHCNAGSKTIAINLPNDERVQLLKGTRRLQLKNAMRAKFDKILVPISDLLIVEDQRGHIQFDAFFGNVMFHEVAHGLGIKNTLDGSGTVRAALKDRAGSVEEAKADILGLYMVTELYRRGELGDVDIRDNYVTFLAGFFRSIRFGASSAHGRANLAQLRFFRDMGAFERDEATGAYRVDFDRMEEAVRALAAKILTLQGDGDYEAATALIPEGGEMDPVLAGDLERLSDADIPVDIVFEQGAGVLGLGS